MQDVQSDDLRVNVPNEAENGRLGIGYQLMIQANMGPSRKSKRRVLGAVLLIEKSILVDQ